MTALLLGAFAYPTARRLTASAWQSAVVPDGNAGSRAATHMNQFVHEVLQSEAIDDDDDDDDAAADRGWRASVRSFVWTGSWGHLIRAHTGLTLGENLLERSVYELLAVCMTGHWVQLPLCTTS